MFLFNVFLCFVYEQSGTIISKLEQTREKTRDSIIFEDDSFNVSKAETFKIKFIFKC